MSRDMRLPQPYEGKPPARGLREPSVRQPAPTHEARKLDFIDLPGREYWWDLLGEALRRRIEEKVGPAIEWWAYCHSVEKERPYAVVFGPNGLAVTTPTMNNAGRPAHMLQVRRFDPESVRYAIVKQRPSAGPAAGSVPDPGPNLPLTEYTRGFLGNLPAEAQGRLQAPFLGDDPLRDSDFHYHGTDEQMNVWCYLAGARTVTFVSGQRVAPADAPPSAASWQLICRMATVVPR